MQNIFTMEVFVELCLFWTKNKTFNAALSEQSAQIIYVSTLHVKI